jgi:hypothetical protein
LDLMQVMGAIKAGQRHRIFDQTVTSIADSHPLPRLDTYTAIVPPCIRDHLDLLYRSLSTIDYRVRLIDFNRIFRRIDICLLVLRNERKYAHWLEERRRRRQATSLKRIGAHS